jgi:hypothetical protein
MGLNTSFNAWDGAYSSFGQWRKWLANQIGINLELMEGFGGQIEWTPYKRKNLYPLLDHSDCDGELTVAQCKRVLKGLEAILKKYPNHETMNRYIDENGWQVDKVKIFIKGCKKAIAANQPIVFG